MCQLSIETSSEHFEKKCFSSLTTLRSCIEMLSLRDLPISPAIFVFLCVDNFIKKIRYQTVMTSIYYSTNINNDSNNDLYSYMPAIAIKTYLNITKLSYTSNHSTGYHRIYHVKQPVETSTLHSVC